MGLSIVMQNSQFDRIQFNGHGLIAAKYPFENGLPTFTLLRLSGPSPTFTQANCQLGRLAKGKHSLESRLVQCKVSADIAFWANCMSGLTRVFHIADTFSDPLWYP